MLFNIALNYGGRAEIVDAARRAIASGIDAADLDESKFGDLLYTAGQPPRRREIHLGARRERDELEPFGRPAAQLTVRVRDERRAMADFPEAIDGQQDLVLATAPGTGRIDVQGKHVALAPIIPAAAPARGGWAVRPGAARASRISGTRSRRSCCSTSR